MEEEPDQPMETIPLGIISSFKILKSKFLLNSKSGFWTIATDIDWLEGIKRYGCDHGVGGGRGLASKTKFCFLKKSCENG